MTAISPRHEPAFTEVADLIREARGRALQAVNTALIDLYWQVGQYVSRKIAAAEWGEGVVDELARWLAREHPDLKGFSRPNIFRMRQFYEAYHETEFVSALPRQLPWTHNVMILGRCKSAEEREFYLRMSLRQRWTSRELERQITAALFERTVAAPKTFVSPAARQIHPTVSEVFRDSYLLDFLDLPEPHDESDLRRGLVGNLKRFLLELGREFCFIGEHHRLQVGTRDFYLDLLFFHRSLRCLVAFELKIEDFQPAHLGQLSFYLEALDRDAKLPGENPSVGVLLCKSKDNDVVEYALSRTLSPALVAEYQTQLPDKAMLRARLEMMDAATRNDQDGRDEDHG